MPNTARRGPSSGRRIGARRTGTTWWTIRRVSSDLGAQPVFREMADEFHRHGLGVVVDVAPNHMALADPEYAQPATVVGAVPGSAIEFAHWFDVDWDAQEGKLLMPILAGCLRIA